MSKTHHKFLIVGGGTAGITVAAQLTRGWFQNRDVTVIEPSDKHFYQPLWTLVGAGVAKKSETVRSEASVMPRKVNWIRDAVATFLPEENAVTLKSGEKHTYDYLIIAAGLQVNWQQIPGLAESVGRDGVCSNYSFETVDSTWEAIRQFKGGNAVFTHPSGAVKCVGAPQKIMYLADDRFREAGVRERTNVIHISALANIFAVPKYRATLEKVIERRGIECRFQTELLEIRPSEKIAVLRNVTTQETYDQPYYLLHVTPPMGPPDFLRQSSLADANGWVDVDPATLRHRRYENVFALGDCSNLPTSKTGAAIRKQAPVVVTNVLAASQKQPLSAKYDGYTSCPLVTGIGKLVLAEFDYEKNPQETFPLDQSKERWTMLALKRYLLPQMYWHGMLKGRA